MNKFSENYKVDSMVKSMLDLELVDYAVMRDKTTDTMYPLSKVSAKKLYKNIGMKSKQFSKNLYDVDLAIWRQLVAKKFENSDALDYLASHKAIILNGEIVNITNDTDVLNKFIKSASELFEGFQVEYQYSDDNKILNIVGIREDSKGLLLRFFLQKDHVEVHEVFKDESGLLNISPFKVVNAEAHTEDIDILLNNDTLIGGLDMIDELVMKDYNKRICNPMSVDELAHYAKRHFRYKLNSDKEFNPAKLIEKHDLGYEATMKLEALATKINESPDEISNVYYSNYLKKSITMTEVAFGTLADVLWAMILEDALDIQALIDLFNSVVRGKCHYMYINN